MPRQTFTWFPDTGADCTTKPSATPTKFGDGYEVRVGSLLNPCPEKWSLKFTRAEQESLAIDQFLRSRAAVESFIWTTPEGNSGVFVCREWKKKRLKSGGAMEVSATFEQVFEA